MSWLGLLIGFLTFILLVGCLLLIFLILIQLPKKEAGAGAAFGGGATDALFGAGSGNVLTKITKYTAALILGLALVLSVLNANRVDRTSRGVKELLQKKASAAVALPPTAATSAPTNTPLQSLTTTIATNSPTAATNSTVTPAVKPPAPAPEK